jgi:hypothetical protein
VSIPFRHPDGRTALQPSNDAITGNGIPFSTIRVQAEVPSKAASRRLHRLVEVRALRVTADETFSLTPTCRDLLPEIITIEVKR